MSTHQDWVKAKQRRDDAALMIAVAYVGGTLDQLGPREAAKFSTAQAEMDRISGELDGNGTEASA